MDTVGNCTGPVQSNILARSRSRYKGARSRPAPTQHIHLSVERTQTRLYQGKPSNATAVTRDGSAQSTSPQPYCHRTAVIARDSDQSRYRDGQRSSGRQCALAATSRGQKDDVVDHPKPLESLISMKDAAAQAPKEKASNKVQHTFDAPVSAVNAGERCVSVEYRTSRLSLSFTPSTTCAELMKEACGHWRISLDDDTMLLLESFQRLGLERPLYGHEQVRSILNSWDFDAQNVLKLMSTTRFHAMTDMSFETIGSRRTDNLSANFRHSQRPRQWEKQSMTLRSDGQISIIKKGAPVNVCHLSEFELYIPTKNSLLKGVKPPKKLCFAIKSQQKSSMFLSSESFVHFVSTNDLAVANKWCNAIRSWRSWYLTAVMGQSQSSKPFRTDVMIQQPGPTSRPKGFATLTPSPAIDMSARQSINPADERTFSSSGLLGRTYTQRRKVQEHSQQRSAGEKAYDLMQNSSRSPKYDLSELERPSPLVDLTPQYQDPPQHRKGKGFKPEVIPAGGLVEVATTPEVAIPIPPSSLWKRNELPEHGLKHSGTVRSRSQRQQRARGDVQTTTAPLARGIPRKGLIHTDDHSQGSLGHGRGVRTGDRNATTPLMNIQEPSQYAPGSLLEQVEQYNGLERRPTTIGRERTREVQVPSGEGT